MQLNKEKSTTSKPFILGNKNIVIYLFYQYYYFLNLIKKFLPCFK